MTYTFLNTRFLLTALVDKLNGLGGESLSQFDSSVFSVGIVERVVVSIELRSVTSTWCMKGFESANG